MCCICIIYTQQSVTPAVWRPACSCCCDTQQTSTQVSRVKSDRPDRSADALSHVDGQTLSSWHGHLDDTGFPIKQLQPVFTTLFLLQFKTEVVFVTYTFFFFFNLTTALILKHKKVSLRRGAAVIRVVESVKEEVLSFVLTHSPVRGEDGGRERWSENMESFNQQQQQRQVSSSSSRWAAPTVCLQSTAQRHLTYELRHRAEGPGVTGGVAVQEGRAHLRREN